MLGLLPGTSKLPLSRKILIGGKQLPSDPVHALTPVHSSFDVSFTSRPFSNGRLAQPPVMQILLGNSRAGISVMWTTRKLVTGCTETMRPQRMQDIMGSACQADRLSNVPQMTLLLA